MICFEAVRSSHFRKTGKQIQQKGELWQKIMDIFKHLANSKVILLKQYEIGFQLLFTG